MIYGLMMTTMALSLIGVMLGGQGTVASQTQRVREDFAKLREVFQ